ncbi:hypothetical protein LCGC14_1979070 [marine sediment metagenome]|uniref:PKD domain-containing protein n=1 Tax=marine sediment metagenome TaxID=412755 RepID=A0A0F9F9T3_9ZZZZ
MVAGMALAAPTDTGRPLEPSGEPASRPVLEIGQDTVLDPARQYGQIVITASNITIDGRGAWLLGSPADDSNKFTQTAISASGLSGVTLRNINAKGWEIGLKITDGKDWHVENCDFSDNFHDPQFGWGENGRRGGIVAERVCESVFRKNRANRVWDACVLVQCHDNTIEDNDFSHTSNTCLKLWNSCRNRVLENDLSYGIRIKPGEVHARDSTCVLIESGSNDNYFAENDCTHGGDGVFIRVLNGWVSTGNVFRQNDCSYANNNCVEAWSPRNTYLDNKANHGSYGFWLGASDQTVLIGNEASHNGDPNGNHNSPHLPEAGHAGIVFMFGPSSHTICRGNTCVGNHGAGIALIGDMASKGKKWNAFHWIIEQNTLRDNRWGIYAQHADWVNVAANKYENNRQGNVHLDGNVTNLTRRPEDPAITRPPKAVLEGPSSAHVRRAVVLDASKSSDPEGHPLQFRWDLGDGTVLTTPRVEHPFPTPGFYRVGLTVDNGLLSDLAWRDFYVVDGREEPATEGQASNWSWVDRGSEVAFSDDPQTRISGKSSILALVQPYSGMRVNLLYPKDKHAAWSLAGKTHLVFWIKAINENLPAWQMTNPQVTLYRSQQDFAVLTPVHDLMSQRPNNEEREGWSYFKVPLDGDNEWKLEGKVPDSIEYFTIGFDSWGAPPLSIWIDGLSVR